LRIAAGEVRLSAAWQTLRHLAEAITWDRSHWEPKKDLLGSVRMPHFVAEIERQPDLSEVRGRFRTTPRRDSFTAVKYRTKQPSGQRQQRFHVVTAELPSSAPAIRCQK
jgi:hypothetical protein